MNMSPHNSRVLTQSRQRDMLAEARNARLAREAELGTHAAREAAPVPYPAAKRRWRRFRLAGLFGA